MSAHATDEELAAYSLGRLDGWRYSRFQRHLFRCGACLARLLVMEKDAGRASAGTERGRDIPVDSVHDTADGLIYSRAERRGDRWFARHWGQTLDGAHTCATVQEANEYLLSSFTQMFPEHRCSDRCRGETAD